MKQLFIAILVVAGAGSVKAQTTMGAAERKMADSLCNAISKIDINKISSAEEANNTFNECFSRYASIIMEIAEERHIDASDDEAMHAIGSDIGKDLLKMNCGAFLRLVTKMSGSSKKTEARSSITGTFKRIDNKGLNYIIISDANGQEKSFLWLRQFSGSEKFMSATTGLAGKKLRVTWQDIEIYLPQAKGYYNVKEVVSIDFQ